MPRSGANINSFSRSAGCVRLAGLAMGWHMLREQSGLQPIGGKRKGLSWHIAG